MISFEIINKKKDIIIVDIDKIRKYVAYYWNYWSPKTGEKFPICEILFLTLRYLIRCKTYKISCKFLSLK